MSCYCSFTYKGIIKPEYRRYVERALEYQDWTEIRSKELKVLFDEWDDYRNELMFSNIYSNIFDDNYIRFDADSGLLEIQCEYDSKIDHGRTDEFTGRHLPFMTEQIVLFHEREADMFFLGNAYYDRTEDFREKMELCNSVYKEKGIDGIVNI